MSVLPVLVPDSEISEMFATADINGDGCINLQEFSHMVLALQKLVCIEGV